MAENLKRPEFVDAWLEDLLDDYRCYGWRKLIPWWAIVSLAVGGVTSWAIRTEFWGNREMTVAFLATVATINGLFLGLSWGSFGKIYEIASEPRFAAYLRKHGLLNTYFFHVDFIHLTQIGALSFAAVTLCCGLIAEIPLIAKQILLAITIASSIYAFRYALGAVRIMQDLVWYASIFEGKQDRPNVHVHEGGKNNLS